MKIAPKKVATIEYTLKDDGGEVLDTSDGREPLAYVHGLGNLVPGLEKALAGREAGDTCDVSVPAAEGYGAYDPALIMRMPVRKFYEKKAIVGKRAPVQMQDGYRVVLVKAVEGDYATVDANHPLAGKTLHFHVKIAGVRDATDEELAHGHVHGKGGHHH